MRRHTKQNMPTNRDVSRLFKVGDHVLVHKAAFMDPLKEIRLPKLTPYWFSPFKVLQQHKTAYQAPAPR